MGWGPGSYCWIETQELRGDVAGKKQIELKKTKEKPR